MVGREILENAGRPAAPGKTIQEPVDTSMMGGSSRAEAYTLLVDVGLHSFVALEYDLRQCMNKDIKATHQSPISEDTNRYGHCGEKVRLAHSAAVRFLPGRKEEFETHTTRRRSDLFSISNVINHLTPFSVDL